MNLLDRISLCLLKLAVHKKRPPLTHSPNSVSTPRGYIPYRRSFVVKSQPWTPSVSARNAQWPDEQEGSDE